MEQRNKSEMDVEAMLLEQALRERVDAALERLRNGTAVYLSHSEAEKRMALFKAKIRGRYRRGGLRGYSFWAGVAVYANGLKCCLFLYLYINNGCNNLMH
ncbi:hypothetical protein [Serratia marcescens]|uniref:hypothetical protein n=1 Tax=Serratia marcescens TaxID=615 RepID=UPI001F236AFE|nr:hypothetical protein [Serratia marcescens]UIM55980.1 hypothetical protein LXH15_02285 [Serratia marcescens]